MTMPAKQQEAYVFGGRIVRPGDQVKLLPARLKKQDEELGDYFIKKNFDFLKNWLGDGPFTISWIGIWPCGRTMLYLKGTKSGEPGACASDFM